MKLFVGKRLRAWQSKTSATYRIQKAYKFVNYLMGKFKEHKISLISLYMCIKNIILRKNTDD